MRVLTSFAAAFFALVAACTPMQGMDDAGMDMGGEGEGEGEADCTEAMAGRWMATGTCYGAEHQADVAVDGCTLTFSNWNMAMSVPDGATVSGDDVTFTGTDWDDCTGTLAEDGMSISGSCSDGCTLTMENTDM